ncbi:MAG: four-carbon acid sugar kinase family protein [Geminicoccaceae bacterium]
MVVRIVADDLTGALDAAAPFAAALGPFPVFWDRAPRSGSYALDTETRERNLADRLSVRHLHGAELAFKKIDSLLRGRTAYEIAICLESGRFRSAIIAPAFPAQERVTREGQQYWRLAPGEAWQPVQGDLLARLRSSVSVGHARSPDAIAGRGFFVCDAETDADLGAVVAAGRRLAKPILWCGSAGLARALAGPARSEETFMPEAPLLMLIGSHHAVSRTQQDALEAHRPGLVTPLASTERAAIEAAVATVADRIGRGASSALAVALPTGSAEAARTVLATTFALIAERVPRPGSLLVTGGETLHGLLQALGAASLLATGEVMPGVPHARITGGPWHDLGVVSKSGGFGAPDLLIRLAESVMP